MRARRSPAVLIGVGTAAVALSVGMATHVVQARRSAVDEVARLRAAAETLAPQAARAFAHPSEAADAEIRAWAVASGLRVTLIAADGRVHADSWTLPSLLGRLENHLARPEVQAARRFEVGVAQRRSVTTDRQTTYVARAVGSAGTHVGFVRLADDSPPGVQPWGVLLTAALAGFAAGAIAASRARRVRRGVTDKLAAWTTLPPGADIEAVAAEAAQRFGAERVALTHEAGVLRAALDEVAEGVVLLDRERTVRLVNPSARRLLSEDLLPGVHLLAAVRAPELLAAVDEAVRGSSPTHTALAGRDGAELAVRVSPLQHETLAVAVVLRDVAGERRLERARRALVADLAHELRTPLTVLGGLAEEMRLDGCEDALAAAIERQVRRLIVFAQELEELARIESGQLRLEIVEADVAALARGVLGDLGGRAESAGVTLRLEAGPCPLRTDPVRLTQVLTNLVDNAVRYNRRGGDATVTCERTEGGDVRVRVEDTGVGIPAADVPLVFQRFYRVRRSGGAAEGSGLGLAIVKHLVAALGGTVHLTSRDGEGTEVTVTLPAAGPVQAPGRR